MNSMKSQMIRLPALALLVALHGSTASADTLVDRDWPCEQALVSEVSAAVVWDGPSVEGLSERWSSDPEVAALVRRLTARRTDGIEPDVLIESFAVAQPPATRDHRLSLLFAGVLQVLNADRHKLNTGILRYARDQQRRAEVLDGHLAEIVRLESKASEESRQRLPELRRRIDLEQRMFDDRERSIPFLCTRPRVVEQRIGELARAIAYHLE